MLEPHSSPSVDAQVCVDRFAISSPLAFRTIDKIEYMVPPLTDVNWESIVPENHSLALPPVNRVVSTAISYPSR